MMVNESVQPLLGLTFPRHERSGLKIQYCHTFLRDIEVMNHVLLVSLLKRSSALLPVRRLFITDEEAHQPIPQPAERQFVLRRTHTSSTSLTDRELFWYREKLFSRLRASWKELGGGRSGELMIRNERLDDEMLPVLKSENVCMDLRLQAGPSTQAGKLPLQPQGTCKVNDFVYVRIHISSRTSRYAPPMKRACF